MSTILNKLPRENAPWPDVESFCALIGGPDGDPRSIDELHEIAHQVEADSRAATTDDLLAAIYFHWRAARGNDGEAPEDSRAIRTAISELRRRRTMATLKRKNPT